MWVPVIKLYFWLIFFTELEALLGNLSEREAQSRHNLMSGSLAYVRNEKGKKNTEILLAQI